MYYIRKKNKKATGTKKTAKASRKPDLVKKLDRVFSLYVRLRDTMPNGYCRCISCGQLKPFEQIDAGHFWSRTHMATRFSELNVHGECSWCNRFVADHLIGYQENLKRKIGLAKFEYLQVAAHQTRKWSDFELEAMIKHYSAEVRRLSAEKGLRVKL